MPKTPNKKTTTNATHHETPYTAPIISFLNFLKNPSLISSSRSPTLAFTTAPTNILFPLPRFFVYGGQMVATYSVGIEGFMVSSVGRRFLVGRFGHLVPYFRFLAFKNTETQKQDWKKTLIFLVTKPSD